MFVMDHAKPLAVNAETLRRYLGLSDESEIADSILSFTITKHYSVGAVVQVDLEGELVTTQVGPKKYKSAMLVSLLWQRHGKPAEPFQLTLEDRVTVIEYFGALLVAMAITDPDTEHTTIRDLLAVGVVKVSVQLAA